ncbi:GNAT family N-acetyltransferase [Roseovarius sp. A21]|uniref:GNAT family N-acetyltransferase n=1 Tax=Roseovarius bejariae TaxID=2576383 RepID=A0A844CMP0_9RHOB|nr:GNAT family N-acetyltransferase [Roseovarius bejariae]MRU16047.1 GNAT family N-acetyltransferase [Roseovarius bejariae]
MTPDTRTLYAVTEATWPPARAWRLGPWTIRDGAGGGKRVSAATAEGAVSTSDLEQAEVAMRELGQTPLFMIRQGDEALDAMLADQGYSIIDPVNLYVGPVAPLTQDPPARATAYAIWEPLEIQTDIWAEGGIGPARIAVMQRAQGPKTAILTRNGQHPAGVAFTAIHDGIAMLHALEVRAEDRLTGQGRNATKQAALWAAQHGAEYLATLCTQENTGANALYTSLGMACVGQYHYRIKQEGPDA